MTIDISPPVPLSEESRPITTETCVLNNGTCASCLSCFPR